jgi:4-amino-4-deoxy-L-arabinose transferase-like glycosyltransferase
MKHRLFASPWLLVVLLLLLMALRPLATPDEGRYAEVGRWMWLSGDWLVQRLNGLPFFHKPPLLYWLEASAFAVLGVSVWAARAVIALHAALMAGMLWWLARAWAGEAVAHRAVWVLGASAAFLIGGQYINHDMMVATWMGVAIGCFAHAFMHPPAGEHDAVVHAGWARAGFVACALGVLSKGLIGLLLPGLVLCVWISWTRQWRKVLALPWVSGLLLFGALAVPWFVLAERAQPGMWAYLFGTHQFGRFGGNTFNNAQPIWFYAVALLVLMFPWALWLVPAALRGWRQRAQPWLSLCWIWLVAILGFFSIPNSKLIGYALPVLPPVALLVAHHWQHHLAPKRWASALFGGLVCVSVALVVTVQVLLSDVIERNSSAGIALAMRGQVAAQDTVVVVGGGEYPYDLPFLAQLPRPMEVVQDWERAARDAGDDWHRELLDGAAFDAHAARVLVPYERLNGLDQQRGIWLVVERNSLSRLPPQSQWEPVAQAGRWRLFRSAP